ncbi:MAG: ABC transporter ATP-binding protein [Anaerolineales bacterium]
MGFFAGLEEESYDRSYSDRELLARMAKYFRPYGRSILYATIGLVVTSGSTAFVPVLVSQGVDLLATNFRNDLMWLLAGALFMLGVLGWAANWLRRRETAKTAGDVMLDLRQDAFSAVAEQAMSFFGELSSGRIVSRITSDTEEFARVLILLTDVLSQFLQMGVLLVILLSTSWRLTLWLMAFMPVLLLMANLFRRMARGVTRDWLRALANVNAAIKEAVTGIAVAKNFRQEQAIYEEFDRVNQRSYGVNVKRGLVLSMVFPALNSLGGLATGWLVYVGGMSAVQGAVTVGAWFLFVNSLDRFWFPVLNLSSFWSQVQGGLSAAERVFALIDAESDIVQLETRPVPKLKGEVRFESLDFHYNPEEPVLTDFTLRIAPGENVALVGHTGAGKSTIAKLIARFYEFQDGRLLVDGLDIRRLDLKSYRRQLGLVPQSPFLFSDTVAANIRYANPEASDDEILKLAHTIGDGEWLETLPQGIRTEVGERGGRLSMGQRQLVSLMRVLIQKPAIFILDEATASVDPFTEWQIQQALNMVLAETTSIMIAHRLSTVKASDRIIVLREGEIIEQGDHDQLMDNGGHYAELYNTYFRHQSLEYIEGARRAALGD